MIEIHWGIREKAKFLDVMRDLTATVEAGFAVLEKENGIRGRYSEKLGMRDCLKKGAGMLNQDPTRRDAVF